MKPKLRQRQPKRGVTLVELLVTVAVLGVLLAVMFAVLQQAGRVVQRTSRQANSLQESRAVFARLAEALRTATVVSAPHFFDHRANSFDFENGHRGQYELRPKAAHSFVTGPSAQLLGEGAAVYPGDAMFFAAARGETDDPALEPLRDALNGLACLVEHGSESASFPNFLSPWLDARSRYRLKLYVEASENFALRLLQPDTRWYQKILPADLPPGATTPRAQVLAENVVALLVLPLHENGKTLAGGTVYDTQAWRVPGLDSEARASAEAGFNRLPGALRVALVTIPETVAARLAEKHGTVPPLDTTPTRMAGAGGWDATLQAWRDSFDPTVEVRLQQTIIPLPRGPFP